MKRFLMVILILLIVGLLYWFLIRKPGGEKGMDEEDRLALVADVALNDDSQPHDSIVFPASTLGGQLQEHMMVLAMPAETIEEADLNYQNSINELKKNAGQAVILLSDAYKKTEAKHYFNRWGIVKTLGDIEDISAYPTLADIVRSDIPPETSSDLHHFSTQEEEVIIRIRAIESLGMLARSGSKASDSLLLRLALDSTITNSAIRIRAIKSYLKAGKNSEERLRILRSRIGEDYRDMVTLSVTPPEEFIKNMEAIKNLSADSTRLEDFDKPQTNTPSPKIGNN